MGAGAVLVVSVGTAGAVLLLPESLEVHPAAVLATIRTALRTCVVFGMAMDVPPAAVGLLKVKRKVCGWNVKQACDLGVSVNGTDSNRSGALTMRLYRTGPAAQQIPLENGIIGQVGGLRLGHKSERMMVSENPEAIRCCLRRIVPPGGCEIPNFRSEVQRNRTGRVQSNNVSEMVGGAGWVK